MSGFPSPPADKTELEEGVSFTPRFDRDGLLTCVTVSAATNEVLMVAHMNAEALRLTLDTGIAHYWSRSRQALWKKGETSGAFQHVRGIRVDCDQDAIVMKVDVDNPDDTCHTGRRSCFYRVVRGEGGSATLVAEG